MLSTTIFFALFLSLLVSIAILWAFFLRIGLRWARVPGVTVRRLAIATIAALSVRIVTNVMFEWMSPLFADKSYTFLFFNLGASALLSGTIISLVFAIPLNRALKAWIPTFLATLIYVGVNLTVVRPLVFEAYSMPTNAMAPTLLGQHLRGVCPTCDEPSFCSPPDESFVPPNKAPLAICKSFHTSEIENTDRIVLAGDRILVARFLRPQRWDLIVFRFPGEPTVNYVERIVGLPGEEITIKDGGVWADGTRLVPPPPIEEIEYASEIPHQPMPALWGSESRPALLGEDEYFVLGDFSVSSLDSRVWQNGAPGHSPYAVPKSHVVGVVTHTFWPASRWQIHR